MPPNHTTARPPPSPVAMATTNRELSLRELRANDNRGLYLTANGNTDTGAADEVNI